MDFANLAVREKGPKRAFFVALINLSKICTDKNRIETPTREGKATQQKRRPIRSALKNGGAVIFDGVRVLRTLSGDAQFSVYQAINRQKTGI